MMPWDKFVRVVRAAARRARRYPKWQHRYFEAWYNAGDGRG